MTPRDPATEEQQPGSFLLALAIPLVLDGVILFA